MGQKSLLCVSRRFAAGFAGTTPSTTPTPLPNPPRRRISAYDQAAGRVLRQRRAFPGTFLGTFLGTLLGALLRPHSPHRTR